MVNVSRGLLLALGSYALLTGADAAVKLLGARYAVIQIAFFNCAFALVAILAVALLRGDVGRMRPRRWRLHLTRGLVTFLTTLVNFWSYVNFPLSQIYALLFSTPLIASVLAVILLGESVSPRRWAAIAAGFGGVLLVLDPFHADFQWVSLFSLLGAFGAAVNMIMLRQLGLNGETIEATGTVGNLFALSIVPFFLPAVWVTPTASDAGLIVLAGLLTGSSFLLLAAAFHMSQASNVAPAQYAQLAFALAVDILVFGELPGVAVAFGALVVLASCVWAGRRTSPPPTGRADGRKLSEERNS